MLPSFNSFWIIYAFVTISLQSNKLFALQCYESVDRSKTVMCNNQCRLYGIMLHELQNFYWDLFLEDKLEVDQIKPNDEIDVPDEFLFQRGGCMDMDKIEDIENPQLTQQCKKYKKFPGWMYCFCNTNLCNGNFKVPRNLIRNGGQRKISACHSTLHEKIVECTENQLCTMQLDVTKVEKVIRDQILQGQQLFGSADLAYFYQQRSDLIFGCTQDPAPLLLNHSKGECIFSGDVTNHSMWTCRCNIDYCNGNDIYGTLGGVFLTDDLSSFPNSSRYDESRVRCLSTEVVGLSDRSKEIIDRDVVWCQPNEVCTVRIDLLREIDMRQGVGYEKSVVYQGCYKKESKEGIVIHSEDGDDCRNLDTIPNIAWRCVCKTPLCNWYRHSKLTNSVPRPKKEKKLYCFSKQKRDDEVDLNIVVASVDHFCVAYVSFAVMEEHYQHYVGQKKLEESVATLEEPLSVNSISVVYQDIISDDRLANFSEVGHNCTFSFAENQKNEKLWACLCKVSFCNAIENVKFMPNELRQNKPLETTTTTQTTTKDDDDSFVNKIGASFLWWTVPVARILTNV